MLNDTLSILRCPCCAVPSPLAVRHSFASNESEIIHGVLSCDSCGRWFRVQDGIPDLVRDGLREWDDEREFLHRHASQLSAEELARLTFPPAGHDEDRSPADQLIVEEGRHWGRFMRRFWDVGDRSIFDIRIKGTHPGFYVAGILEPDDRDSWKPWGIFPPPVGDACFSWLPQIAGARGVDIGCGGGQFGLEAARQGLLMVGLDPSFEEVSLAREHARQQGIATIDYVRGEPANPPFAPGSFDLVMAKDSLHHVPDLDAVFPRLLQIATPHAHILVHEHVAKAPIKSWLMGWIGPRAINKIRSRWPKVEIPPELLRDSANEDVSAHLVRSAIESAAERIHAVESLFLAEELELIAHYAFGKRRWVTRSAYLLGWWVERLLLLAGDRQHLTWHGRRR